MLVQVLETLLNSFITKPKIKKVIKLKKKKGDLIKEKAPRHTHTNQARAHTQPTEEAQQIYLSILSRKDRAVSRSIIPYLFGRLTGSRGGNEEMSIKT